MDRRFFTRTGGGLLAAAAGLFAVIPARAQEASKKHRLAFQVTASDPAIMNLALLNAANAAALYTSRKEDFEIEFVAFGPGYLMLRDISPVKDKIAELRQKLPGVRFSACQNSRKAVAKAENKTVEEIVELAEATDVPAGVVRIAELQEQGWSYIRP